MLSESDDHTVPVSLSDDEHPDQHQRAIPPGRSSPLAPSLLEEQEDHEIDDTSSKLRLDPNTTGESTPARDAPTPTPTPASISPSSGMSSYSSLPRSITPVLQQEDTNFVLTVSIQSFEKRGEGINAYIVYKVISTCENVPGYSDKTYEVWRRFSDFLGLREKLVEKYQTKGVIVPAAPEKSIAAMTKTKTEPAPVTDLPIRRSRQLERFLRRIVLHPKMRCDCDVRDFLTMATDLPHATQTATLSGAGVKRMISRVSDVFNKMAFHMEEGDRWFEQAQSQVDELDESLRKVLLLAENLASTRKDLSSAQESLGKALSLLASCEESTSLARALSHLTETEENTAALWAKQAEYDNTKFAESLSEYVGLIGALKDVFNERVRMWQRWQESQQTLHKKRDQKSRMELAGRADKANQLKYEIEETQKKMDQQEQEFIELSRVIREEISRFETQRRQDMKQMFVDYLRSLIQTHTEMLKLWEKFAPETASIIV